MYQSARYYILPAAMHQFSGSGSDGVLRMSVCNVLTFYTYLMWLGGKVTCENVNQIGEIVSLSEPQDELDRREDIRLKIMDYYLWNHLAVDIGCAR
jgi:hypothetical protein